MIREISCLRVDPCGGVTDIPEIGRRVGTTITNIGIDLFSDENYIQKRQLQLDITRRSQKGITFVQNGSKGKLNGVGNSESSLVEDTVSAFTQHHPLKEGYEITLEDSLPKKTGLGGSAGLSMSLNVGLNHALANESNQEYIPNPNNVLAEAHHFEVEELGIKGGFQDFVGAFFGNVNLIDFPSLESVDLSTYPTLGVQMEPEMRDYLNKHMVILLFKDNNISSDVVVRDMAKHFQEDTDTLGPVAEEIKRCNREAFSLLTQPGNLEARLQQLGETINRSWELHKEFSPLIGQGRIGELEDAVSEYTYAVRGPGSGANSLFLILKPDSKGDLGAKLSPFAEDIEILYAKVNESGIRRGRQVAN